MPIKIKKLPMIAAHHGRIWPVVATGNLDNGTIAKIQNVLLMISKDPEAIKYLQNLSFIQPQDYSKVKKAMNSLFFSYINNEWKPNKK
jgi:hypothetical protein